MTRAEEVDAMRTKPELCLILVGVVLITACSPPAIPQPVSTNAATATATATPKAATAPSPTTTPTPTPVAQMDAPPTTAPSDVCAGLSGHLEIQLLVGPSEAVGLEPLVVGQLPFAVTGNEAPYPLNGATFLTYQDTLVQEWGTFEVQFDADMTVDGTCVSTDQATSLEMIVTMDGEQLVTVTSEGFNAEYPWAGTHTREFVMPAKTGATAQGEGWAFVLYLE